MSDHIELRDYIELPCSLEEEDYLSVTKRTPSDCSTILEIVCKQDDERTEVYLSRSDAKRLRDFINVFLGEEPAPTKPDEPPIVWVVSDSETGKPLIVTGCLSGEDLGSYWPVTVVKYRPGPMNQEELVDELGRIRKGRRAEEIVSSLPNYHEDLEALRYYFRGE